MSTGGTGTGNWWASVIRVVTTGAAGPGPGPGRGCLPVAFLSESLPLFNVKAHWQDSVSNKPSNLHLAGAPLADPQDSPVPVLALVL